MKLYTYSTIVAQCFVIVKDLLLFMMGVYLFMPVRMTQCVKRRNSRDFLFKKKLAYCCKDVCHFFLTNGNNILLSIFDDYTLGFMNIQTKNLRGRKNTYCVSWHKKIIVNYYSVLKSTHESSCHFLYDDEL